jgi:hypothetical protein
MAFSLKFLNNRPMSIFDAPSLYGEIEIGSFHETFVSPIVFWSREQYESQWRHGIGRILDGRSTSALVTAMPNPRNATHIMWWPLYVLDDIVIIHNHLLMMKSIREKFSHNDPYLYIPPYETTSDDGQPITEWKVAVKELAYYRSTF